MSLSRRLLAGVLAVIAMLVAAIVVLAGNRLNERLARDTEDELAREARLVGVMWATGTNDPDSLADAAGSSLRRRVTLIDSSGVVVGDSEFDGEGLRRLENHADRPEVVEARATGTGRAVRASTSAGDEEMYVAIRHSAGYVRTSIGTSRFGEIVSGARRDVSIASLIALLGAALLAALFSRRVTRPIVELRDVTRAIAAGDLSRRPSLMASGEVGDLAASVSRMTDQIRDRMQAMSDEDARLVAIIESLDEAIVAVDARGDVVRLNESARRLFSANDALPFPSTSLTLGPAIRESLAAAVRGNVSHFETTARDRIVAVTASPLPPGGAVLAVQDLTERRRLETVRRDFVANVSHELKTPLTVIAGFAETLRDPHLAQDDRQRFIDLVAANTWRMQRIVDDLLDLSRYESSTWTPKPADVDLVTVTTELLALFARAASEKRLTLTSHIDPAVRTVHFDPTALRQVLSNLIENAIRYTASGTVAVTARQREGGVVIAVEDTGVGIAPEHVGRIFERFYRVDPGRSRTEGGTGLGLAIVRHLVEAHGGRAIARSVPGHGTTIEVILPRQVASAVQ